MRIINTQQRVKSDILSEVYLNAIKESTETSEF